MYLYTLDSHDCYGSFANAADAHAFAVRRSLTSYQLLATPPYASTLVIPPC